MQPRSTPTSAGATSPRGPPPERDRGRRATYTSGRESCGSGERGDTQPQARAGGTSRPDAATCHLQRSGRGAVVARPKAPVDVVVDHAHVLHERVYARRPDRAVPLRLQLLGEL